MATVEIDDSDWPTRLSISLYKTDDNASVLMFNKERGEGSLLGYPKEDLARLCREYLIVLEQQKKNTNRTTPTPI